MSMFNSLRTAARKRADYNRTVAELSRMSKSAAIDLGIDGRDIRDVAARAVYGR